MLVENYKVRKISFVFLFAGVILFVVSIALDSPAMRITWPPYNPIPELPLIFWSALFLTLVGLSLYFLCESRRDDWIHLVVGILVVLLFYGYLPISQGTLRYMDSWYHSMTANYVVQNGNLNVFDVGYHNWPGFYLWYASLRMITGLDFPMLGRFVPTIMNVVFFIWLFLFYRRLSLGNGTTALLGLITFIVANDRFVFHVAPIGFTYAMLAVFIYLIFLRCSDRRLWVISQVFLFAIIISHALSVLWVFSTILILLLIINWLLNTRSLLMYRLRTTLIFGVCVWISWFIYWVAEYWWRYGIGNFSEAIGRILGGGSPLEYTPSYWRFGVNPPLEAQFSTLTILATVLFLALLGTFKLFSDHDLIKLRKNGKKLQVAFNFRKQKLNKKSLPFLTLLALLAGVFASGFIPFLLSPGILAERLLLFFWFPVSFFACSYVVTLQNKTLRRICILGLIWLLLPSFVTIRWAEFHFVTHQWETSAFEFSASRTTPGPLVLTDQETGFILRYFSPNSTVISDYSRAWFGGWHSKYGLLKEVIPVIYIFIGNASPTSYRWTYFIRSERQESRLGLIYDYSPTLLKKADAFLDNTPPISHVYDNGHVRIFFQALNIGS